jgi:transposase
MRKIKDVLRLHAAGLSQRHIATSLKLSNGVVCKYLRLAQTAGVSWPLPPDWNDQDLAQRLSPPVELTDVAVLHGAEPDFVTIHQELKRKGVTRQLLWEEYQHAHPNDAYSYPQFCLLYRTWAGRLQRSLRQTHLAGEKLFVDYAGPTAAVVDASTGEIKPAQIFVAVWGASNFTYAEATWTQALPDWIGSHVRAFTFFGGVPALIVPDNLKAAVSVACRYEPELNPTYADLAAHYGTAVLPARPYKPKDKAKVEVGVQVVERWILARLRHHTFFSLSDLNAAIRALLVELNHRPFKKLPGSRRSQFETLDRPALKPLPAEAYDYADWKKARVNIDYHIEIDGHYYSVPHAHVKESVDVRLTATTVECLAQGQRIASHARSHRKGAHTTVIEHMPKAHQKHQDWTPGRFLTWALDIGPRTRDVVKHLLEHRPHPEHGYRSCLGLLGLAKRFGPARLEAACERALIIGAPTRKSVLSILDKGLDRVPLPPVETQTPLPLLTHDNVRGPDYYH